MSEQIVNFELTNLAVQVDESISLEWQSSRFGILTVERNEKLTDISAPAVKSL